MDLNQNLIRVLSNTSQFRIDHVWVIWYDTATIYNTLTSLYILNLMTWISIKVCITLTEVKCELLFPPKHGEVEGKGPFHAGDRVQVSCKSGYELHGHGFLTCQEHGLWSQDMPTCKCACAIVHRLSNYSLRKIILCG